MHGWHYLSYFFAQHSIFCWAFRVSFQYLVIWLCRGHIPDSYHESTYIYIYIYRAYYKLDSQLFNSCQIIYKPLYVLGSKHGFTWFLAIPCLLGILIPIPKLWVNQLIQSKLNDHIWPSQPPPWKIKRGWKITERDGWILQPLQPRGWWHQCRSMSIPWLTQTTMIDDQNHITNHDSKPWLSHIPTIKLLSLLLSL